MKTAAEERGLTSQGLNLLQNARANGVNIGIVNVMTMDYGSYYDPNQMGAYAVDAMNATISQLATLYGAAKTDAQVRSMVGVTPEIGLNDVTPEVFTRRVDRGLGGAIGRYWDADVLVHGSRPGVPRRAGRFGDVQRDNSVALGVHKYLQVVHGKLSRNLAPRSAPSDPRAIIPEKSRGDRPRHVASKLFTLWEPPQAILIHLLRRLPQASCQADGPSGSQ